VAYKRIKKRKKGEDSDGHTKQLLRNVHKVQKVKKEVAQKESGAKNGTDGQPGAEKTQERHYREGPVFIPDSPA